MYKKAQAVVYDERPWEVVHASKMLLQAGTGGVWFLESNCQQVAALQFLCQAPMITCASACIGVHAPREAAEWITANSVRVSITEAVWEDSAS